MDSFTVKLFCQRLPCRPCPIVRIVNDHLACLEEVPDLLLASIGDLLPQSDSFGALLTLRGIRRDDERFLVPYRDESSQEEASVLRPGSFSGNLPETQPES